MSIFLGTRPEGKVEMPLEPFLRHVVCLGSSGSGKTVAAKVLCEEFVRQGIPVLAIDPQGDIASLALPASPEAVAAKGLPVQMLDEWKARAEVVVWTPASSIGVPLSVNPLDSLSFEGLSEEERVRAIHQVASNLTSLLGYDLASDDGRSVSGALHLVLEHLAKGKCEIRTFDRLAAFLGELPERLGEEVAELLEERKAKDLKRKIHLLSIGAQRLLFQMGVPLDIETLLGLEDEPATGEPRRVRVSVIYLNTLHSQAEKDFFVGELVGSLYDWMLSHPSSRPQVLFYIDEVSPFLPPVKKPACKDALTLLFKQARKYGVSCLLASQNPGDIDYRSLSQFSTWNLGRMMVQQDVKKVHRAIQSIAGDRTEAILARLPNLSPGEFILLSPDAFTAPVELKVRWLLTEHRTLDEDGIREVSRGETRDRLLQRNAQADVSPASQPPSAPAERLAPVESSARPGAPEDSVGRSVEALLVRERRAMTAGEIVEVSRSSEAAVRRSLHELEEQGAIEKEKGGRSFHYWAKPYRFFPELGVDGPVSVARMVTHENGALGAATAATAALFGLVKKEFGPASYRHMPLWRVRCTVTEESGFLFWKERRTRGEFLYFHPASGALLVATAKGIEFVPVVAEEPGKVRDLDDVATFEEKTPDEVGLDRATLQRLLPERKLRTSVERKFPIHIEECRLAFLPYWEFPVKGEGRSISIDAVLGRPIDAWNPG